MEVCCNYVVRQPNYCQQLSLTLLDNDSVRRVQNLFCCCCCFILTNFRRYKFCFVITNYDHTLQLLAVYGTCVFFVFILCYGIFCYGYMFAFVI